MFIDGVPAHREPEVVSLVSPIIDEALELGVGYEAISEFEGLDEHLVAWLLVIEAEVLVGVSDHVSPARDGHPCLISGCLMSWWLLWVIGRHQGVAGEDVLDVGEDQLLVLLLVVAAEFHDSRETW